MRTLQFWILVICSSLVSALMIKQIFLSRSLNGELRVLSDAQETASTGPGYENAWKQFALHIFQASHYGQDAALAQVLKDANVQVRPTTAAAASAASAATSATNSIQSPVAPLHPAAH